MEDRLITILTDLKEFCPNVKEIDIDGLIFILQDLYYLDYDGWEEWRSNEEAYRGWLISNLTK